MQKKWTSVLITGALAGSLAVTTGIAVSHAAADNHPMVSAPAQAPAGTTKTLTAIGDLGAVLRSVSDLAAAGSPANGTKADPAALKAQLVKLNAAANQLRAALPAAGGSAADGQPAQGGSGAPATDPSFPAVPLWPGSPADPGVQADPGAGPGAQAEPGANPGVQGNPVANPGGPELAGNQGLPVLLGGPNQRDAAPAPANGVAGQLSLLTQHATALVNAASGDQPDQTAVKQALVPLANDALTLSTAAVSRLTGK
jgi:hypothetical protein